MFTKNEKARKIALSFIDTMYHVENGDYGVPKKIILGFKVIVCLKSDFEHCYDFIVSKYPDLITHEYEDDYICKVEF